MHGFDSGGILIPGIYKGRAQSKRGESDLCYSDLDLNFIPQKEGLGVIRFGVDNGNMVVTFVDIFKLNTVGFQESLVGFMENGEDIAKKHDLGAIGILKENFSGACKH